VQRDERLDYLFSLFGVGSTQFDLFIADHDFN